MILCSHDEWNLAEAQPETGRRLSEALGASGKSQHCSTHTLHVYKGWGGGVVAVEIAYIALYIVFFCLFFCLFIHCLFVRVGLLSWELFVFIMLLGNKDILTGEGP